jgi:plasmid stabilization system protein ParE
MGFQVVWSASALQELKEVCEYIAGDDPEAASRVGNELVLIGGGKPNVPLAL